MPKPSAVGFASVGGSSQAAQAWSPLDLPNLRAWYRGDDVNLSGSSVIQMNDKSGNGYHLAGGVSPTQVTATINSVNYPAVRGNGTSQYLTEATMPHSDGEHIIVVTSKVSLTFGDVLFDSHSALAGMRCRHGGTGDEINMHVGAALISSVAWNEIAGTWFVLETIWGNVQPSLLMRNYSTADDVPDTATVMSPAASTGFRLFSSGGGSPGQYANDDVVEIIISSAAITGTDYTNLKAYTLARYGIG